MIDRQSLTHLLQERRPHSEAASASGFPAEFSRQFDNVLFLRRVSASCAAQLEPTGSVRWTISSTTSTNDKMHCNLHGCRRTHRWQQQTAHHRMPV
jgi:hypothetical protein